MKGVIGFMKKVIAILTQNEKFSITDLLMKETSAAVFLGSWGKILSNRVECVNAISDAVNAFLQSNEKQLIVFACDKNDIRDIKEKIIECDFCIMSYESI